MRAVLRECHHPAYVLSLDPDRELSPPQVESLVAQVKAAPMGEALILVGSSGWVTPVECSWCRKPSGRRSWRERLRLTPRTTKPRQTRGTWARPVAVDDERVPPPPPPRPPAGTATPPRSIG